MTRIAERKTKLSAETSARYHGVPLMVLLGPHEIIIREKGRRLCYAVPYTAIYETGAKLAALEARRLKGRKEESQMTNRFWKVVRPFEVEALVGHAPSNCFIGASMALENVYETLHLKRGDEIHELCGGNFVIHAGKVWEFYTRRAAASEIFLHPPPPYPALPIEKLRALSDSKRTAVPHYRNPGRSCDPTPIVLKKGTQ